MSHHPGATSTSAALASGSATGTQPANSTNARPASPSAPRTARALLVRLESGAPEPPFPLTVRAYEQRRTAERRATAAARNAVDARTPTAELCPLESARATGASGARGSLRCGATGGSAVYAHFRGYPLRWT
jgi:hypothetical protein